MKNIAQYYNVGALLYCPANLESIIQSIVQNKFDTPFSLALCLEDTIKDDCVAEAELVLIHILAELHAALQSHTFYLPKLFIRVREPQQITSVWNRLGVSQSIVTGFIAPKFAPENADAYVSVIQQVNEQSPTPCYFMPILECATIIHIQNRADILYTLKEQLEPIASLVLNIRVGGNDLCHVFGFRRHSNESIHDIRAISNIFADIITVFAMDYVVSGPVWEYYSGEGWDTGFLQELSEDRQCGFVGKTVIHPNQIALVKNAYMVSQTDYDDACAILSWNPSAPSLVAGSAKKERMNEYKTHYNWANQILCLAEVYGISL